MIFSNYKIQKYNDSCNTSTDCPGQNTILALFFNYLQLLLHPHNRDVINIIKNHTSILTLLIFNFPPIDSLI